MIAVAAIVSPYTAGSTNNAPLVPIRLANLSSESPTLHKGTKIAQMSPIMDSEIVNGVSQESQSMDSELSDHVKSVLWEMVQNSGEVLTDHQQHELYRLLLDVLGFTDTELADK